LTENRTGRLFYGYVIVSVAFLIMVTTWGTLYSFGVFFKPVLTELGWTRAATSGAYSLCMLLLGFSAIFAGRLNDRFGPRLVSTVCGLSLGSGYLLMSQIGAIWQLYLFYGVMLAIGAGGSYTPLASTISRWFVKRRGWMVGIAVSGIGFGTLIMSPSANWLIASYGWRTSYVIVGIVALILIILPAQFLRRDPAGMGMQPYGGDVADRRGLSLEAGGFSLRRATGTRQFWMVATMFLFIGISIQVILVHIVPHATDLAVSAAHAANVLAVIGGAGVVGRIVVGGIADRIGSRLALITSFVIMLASLVWLLFAEELWMFYLFAAAFGVAYGGFSTLIALTAAELFGLSSLGVITGALIFSTATGEAIGPALAGGIFDVTGSYQLAFLICVILCVIAIGISLFLRPVPSVRRRE